MHVLRRALLVAPLLVLAASGRLAAAPAQTTWPANVASSLTAAAPASSPGFLSQMLATGDPVVAAAGDIACDPTNTSFNGGAGTASNCRQRATSDLLVGAGLSAVLPLGDNQNYCGSLAAYQQAYDPSWGRVKSISHPAVGNHEYLTSGGGSRGTLGCDASNQGAAGYFAYWGAAAGSPGQGYYSFDVGPNWHVVVLNTNCGDAGGCTPTSAQGRWLAADLAANTRPCTLAAFHIPLFSSGGRAAQNARPLWDALYAAHADVVLDGHDHIYERFAQQTPTGAADSAGGIREFIVGTGGENHTSIAAVAPNSQVRNTTTYGVLELALHPTSYDWQFVPEAGKTFTDSGTTTCHNTTNTGGDTTPPTPPGNLTATATSPTSVQLTWTAAQDTNGIAAYQILRNQTPIATTTQTTYTDTTTQPATTYTYTITAQDPAGNHSQPSNTTTITTPPAPPSNTLTFGPAADTYVEQGQPGVNFGSSTQFVADASPVRRSLLKFTVSGLAGRSVTHATLRIYCANGSSTGGAIHRVPSSSWGEQTVTWSNAPAGDTAVLGNVGAVAAGSWYSVDVTSLVTGDGTFSLDLTSTNADGAYYSSKEGPAGQAPQLVVTTAGGADVTAPDAPTGLALVSVTSSRVELSWVAARDDVGVVGYRVLRGGVEVGRTTTQTTFADTSVRPSTGYSYTVVALDAAGNESAPSAVLGVTTPAASGATVSVVPVADTYVSAAAPAANYGTQTQIRVDGSPLVRSYLRFSVSGLGGSVASAVLRIYANSAQSTGFAVYSVADTGWAETALTYANAPALGVLRGSSGAVAAATWKSVDVTGAISGNGAYAFALTTSNATALSLASREAGANAPQLVITTTG